jgi:hypothetical protein
MVPGSLPLAIAPRRFPSKERSDFPHAAALACEFVRADSIRGSSAVTLERCRDCSVRNEQSQRRVICSHSPLSFRKSLCGTPPAQHAFSPLLLEVGDVQYGCRNGSTPRIMKRSHYTNIHGKDLDRKMMGLAHQELPWYDVQHILQQERNRLEAGRMDGWVRTRIQQHILRLNNPRIAQRAVTCHTWSQESRHILAVTHGGSGRLS